MCYINAMKEKGKVILRRTFTYMSLNYYQHLPSKKFAVKLFIIIIHINYHYHHHQVAGEILMVRKIATKSYG